VLACNQDIQNQYINWIRNSDVDVFATLKFANGYDISDAQAEQVLRVFLNKADRTFLGKTECKLGRRIERFVFKHYGKSGFNTHFHVAFKSFGGTTTFCNTLKTLWSSFDESCATSRVELIRNKHAASVYCLHEYGQLKQDTFNPQLSYTNTVSMNASDFDQMRYLRRLVKANYGTKPIS